MVFLFSSHATMKEGSGMLGRLFFCLSLLWSWSHPAHLLFVRGPTYVSGALGSTGGGFAYPAGDRY